MLQQQQTRTNSRGEAYVIGPTGAPLTLRDLPPPDAAAPPWADDAPAPADDLDTAPAAPPEAP